MIFMHHKLLFPLLLLLAFYVNSFGQNAWIGYEQIRPLDNASDIFKWNASGSTSEIQIGRGITACNYFSRGQTVFPFIKAGYLWHSKYKSEVMIDSALHQQEVFYRTIPISAGIDVAVIRHGFFSLLISLDAGYNFITRHQLITDLNDETKTSMNKFGYSIGLNPYFDNDHMRLNVHLGLAKKGDQYFTYFNFLLPLWFINKKE